MSSTFEFTLNGRPVTVANTSPNLTLLEFLRAHGCTGAKEGCAEGDCGACTVALRSRDAHGRPAWRTINSCLVPLPSMAGRELMTVEGLPPEQPGGLHAVQQCLVDQHGSQCGYCTPGIAMSMFEAWDRADLKSDAQVEDQLCGNLCRCTGYRSIIEAARVALAMRPEPPAPPEGPRSMVEVRPSMEYESGAEQFFRPATIDEVAKLLRRHPEAQLVAGATELGLELTKRHRKFPLLISLENVNELRGVMRDGDCWRIGAATTLTELEDALGTEYPDLRNLLRWFGSRQIRNRATVGGNLATGSPIGDLAPFLLAHGARLVLTGRGTREMPIESFFTGYRQTALLPREIIWEVYLPRTQNEKGVKSHSAFYKASRRREMDISTVSACFVMDIDETGEVRHVKMAFGGVAAMPMRARKAEKKLMARIWNEKTHEKVLEALAEEFTPISDVRGSAAYRVGLLQGLFRKFVDEVASPTNRSNTVAITAPVLDTKLPPPHESAHLHVTGQAAYADDQTAGAGMLEVWPVCSPHAHARITRRDATEARTLPGIHAVLLAEDIPGLNDTGVVRRDEPLLAKDEVLYHGQIVALVVGNSQEACRAAAEKVVVEYEVLPAIFSIEEAIAKDSFHTEANIIRRGDAAGGFANSPHRLEGNFSCGGQDHFYLETQAAWARPGEDGTFFISSSTQHPSEVQAVVAHVLDLASNKVVVQVPRMGGAFGGKETQAVLPAALAALAAQKTGRAVRVRFNRDQDMAITGKRHPFLARFKAGFDANGLLLALQAELISNGGWSLDLSMAVTDRALFHLDNAYFIPSVEASGRVAKTNLASNTAFRGFGGPQGMLIIEEILDRVARQLGLAPELVRERNLYRGAGATNTTHYGQEIGDNRLQLIWQELKVSSRLNERRAELATWNAQHPHRKRGLAITPVKFGISFTVSHLNQAGALVIIYQDGSVQVNHGGTEMGQGLHTNIRAIAARELGIAPNKIRVMPTSTDKVPNTSATAASAGTDLNGAAVKAACETLITRLRPLAAKLLGQFLEADPLAPHVRFAEGSAFSELKPELRIPFTDVVMKAYLDRVSLSATGYYATPGISWNRATGTGRPFHYFANGAAVTEVEVDEFTGMMEVLRTDILQDCGDSINTGINRGQVEGGFVQGLGWLTMEELKWDEHGRLLTHSPDTYKIPAVGDRPRVFNAKFLERATQPDVIHGSKAVGEPPLMLAISVREAIRDAVAAFGAPGGVIPLASPATSEAIFTSVQERLRRPWPEDSTSRRRRRTASD
jgi:xanthine dehydrogenase molybdopterin binding subunit/xanthine dehydrogenase small subunit